MNVFRVDCSNSDLHSKSNLKYIKVLTWMFQCLIALVLFLKGKVLIWVFDRPYDLKVTSFLS